jgi:hypothetical protein
MFFPKPIGNTLPLNLFFPTHSVLFPSALLASERTCVTSPFFGQGTTSFFFLMVICNSLLLLKSLPINIINCIKFHVNCSALTALIMLLLPFNVRGRYIRKTADLLHQLWVSTFPRFVAIGFYFLGGKISIGAQET